MINWETVFQDTQWFHWTGITPALSQGTADACLEAIEPGDHDDRDDRGNGHAPAGRIFDNNKQRQVHNDRGTGRDKLTVEVFF